MCDGEPVLSTEHVTHLCGGWKPSDAEINALPGAPFTATESVIISIAWQGVRLSPESVVPALEALLSKERKPRTEAELEAMCERYADMLGVDPDLVLAKKARFISIGFPWLSYSKRQASEPCAYQIPAENHQKPARHTSTQRSSSQSFWKKVLELFRGLGGSR